MSREVMAPVISYWSARRKRRRLREAVRRGVLAFVLGSAVLGASAWYAGDIRPPAPANAAPTEQASLATTAQLP